MFKHVTAALLLLAFVASTFCSTVIVVEYYSNTAAFAKDCVNKARPMMHCNGKCQLIKKLEQNAKDEQQNLERKMENKVQSLAEGFTIAAAAFTWTSTTITFFNYDEQLQQARATAIFHPPCIA